MFLVILVILVPMIVFIFGHDKIIFFIFNLGNICLHTQLFNGTLLMTKTKKLQTHFMN